MRKEIRTVIYDEELRVEAYRFEGIVQPFPNHFHEYYVIGFMERGKRALTCKNRDYILDRGDIVLFCPGENHACAQIDGGTLSYCGLNIGKEVMLDLAEEVTGKRELPRFSQNVILDDEIVCCLCPLHKMVMEGAEGFGKEELLLLLISTLIQKYGQPFENRMPEYEREIEQACAFMEAHYQSRIYLDQICRHVGLSKSTLLRAFTKAKGITPYRYLETVRIGEAKKLLGQGVPPMEAAIRTGFSDQSHFTNYFSSFIGLAPGAYREIFAENGKGGESHEK